MSSNFMKAARALLFILVTVCRTSASDQPLQSPSWLTPFAHEHENLIVAVADHLRISYDAGPFLAVVGHYETVLRRATELGVMYREGTDGVGGALFRASQNRTACSVEIRQASAGAHVEVDCVISPEIQTGPVTASDAAATLKHPDKGSSGTPPPAVALERTIRLSVLRKGFIPSDAAAGRYEALFTLNCAYQNTSGRDVRAFTGTVLFEDLFGREIFKSRITISDAIASGQAATWSGTAHYNQFIESHKRFLATPLENMKVVWVPASIIFSDGTQIGEPR